MLGDRRGVGALRYPSGGAANHVGMASPSTRSRAAGSAARRASRANTSYGATSSKIWPAAGPWYHATRDPDRPGPPKVVEAGGPRFIVRIPCGDCNGGWMGSLDDAAVSLVSSMARGRTVVLDLDARQTLAAWAAKVILCMSAKQPGAGRVCHASTTSKMGRTHRPPAGMTLWLGSVDRSDPLQVPPQRRDSPRRHYRLRGNPVDRSTVVPLRRAQRRPGAQPPPARPGRPELRSHQPRRGPRHYLASARGPRAGRPVVRGRGRREPIDPRRLTWPSWRWMTLSGTPSRSISTACACRRPRRGIDDSEILETRGPVRHRPARRALACGDGHRAKRPRGQRQCALHIDAGRRSGRPIGRWVPIVRHP